MGLARRHREDRCKCLAVAISALFVLAPSRALAQASPAGPTCRGFYADLAAEPGPFGAGILHEEAILAGEAPREYGAARRELTKQFSAEPIRAQDTALAFRAKGLAAQGGSPGAALLALDVLGKAAPGEFVGAVRGMLTRPLPARLKARPEALAAFQNQLGSRLLSHLPILPPDQALQLADLMARSPWLRRYVGRQDNAARTLLNFKKALAAAPARNASEQEKLTALRVLADEWIEPRRLEAATNRFTMSDYPETDWAFSLVLAREMARFFEAIDPAVAKSFSAKARELSRAEVPAAFRANPRVKGLFEEFEIID